MSIVRLGKQLPLVAMQFAICVAVGGFLLYPNPLHAQGMPTPGYAGTSETQWALVPMPREIQKRPSLSLSHGVGVSTSSHGPQDTFTVKDLVRGLKDRGIEALESRRGSARIILLRRNTRTANRILARAHVLFSKAMHGQGYVLLTEGNRCYDIAATSAGLYYGAQTIKQLVIRGRHGSEPVLRGVLIRDWPAMKYRGVSDDLSRGPFPTLRFQEHQVRVLSEYKMNVYSPYFENTLAYPKNPLAALPGGSMTPSDVKALVRYARHYHVTIIPEQESFGHLNHLLTYDIYSKLSDTPHGSMLATVQPGSLRLIRQWFTQIASMFPGPFVHIGADETYDLGRGQTRALVKKEGMGKAYVDFLKQIHQTLAPLHKRILFWGDMAKHSPELVKTLPKDMIAVPWDYGFQKKGVYVRDIKPYADAGMETWVAPGIANWARVYPDYNAGFNNIRRFVAAGQRLGSKGELNTVWNDSGEGLFNLDWYGVLYGAAAGWESAPASIAQFQNSYGQVFHGDMTGKINLAQKKLMAAQKLLETAGVAGDSDHLFWVDPWSAEGQRISAKLLPVVYKVRIDAEKAIILIDEARDAGNLRELDALSAVGMAARRLDFIGYKFEIARQMAEEYNRAYWEQNDPADNSNVSHELILMVGGGGQCQNVGEGYGVLRGLYRQAWLDENRPYWLDNVMARYEMAQLLWRKRKSRFAKLQRRWYRTHTLPPPQSVGVPAVSISLPQVSAQK